MRRFGIPILLCSAYIFIMLLVFSTDFGQQSTLFFPKDQAVSQIDRSDADAETTAHAGDTIDAEEIKVNASHQPLFVPVKDGSNQAEGGDNNPSE